LLAFEVIYGIVLARFYKFFGNIIEIYFKVEHYFFKTAKFGKIWHVFGSFVEKY
tara:strand:+ start:107 stop:268 length:162 start_codon:yes stop_codon:yes gene_type:complete